MIIYKYEIGSDALGATVHIQLPQGAKSLSVAFQKDKLMLWAIVNPTVETETRKFVVFGTGWVMPGEQYKNLIFIGTTFIERHVWHVFEDISK